MRKSIIVAITLLIFSNLVNAQGVAEKNGLDGLLRSNGRIYVVVAVILTILLGLFIYLIRLDRKITRLEKEK